MTRKPRRELTIDDVFNEKKKPRYLAILMLLNDFSRQEHKNKMKFYHLKYVLVKNYKVKTEREREKLETYFWRADKKEQYEELTKRYEKGDISKDMYFSIVKIFKVDELDTMQRAGFLSEDIKFSSEGSLRYAIGQLKNKLKLVDSQKSKKGYDFIVLTEYGAGKYQRWKTHNLIDKIPDNSIYMKKLCGTAYEYAVKSELEERLKKGKTPLV